MRLPRGTIDVSPDAGPTMPENDDLFQYRTCGGNLNGIPG